MADKKISDFDRVSSLNNTDLFLVSGQNDTYNTTFSTIKQDVQSGMLDSNMGSENSGKYLMVGSDGNIILKKAHKLRNLTVLENGTYTPPDGVDGFSPVVVNTPVVKVEVTNTTLTLQAAPENVNAIDTTLIIETD